jgi:hypothetical protein
MCGITGAVAGLLAVLFPVALGLGATALAVGLAGHDRAKRGVATNRTVARWGAITGGLALILGIAGCLIIVTGPTT